MTCVGLAAGRAAVIESATATQTKPQHRKGERDRQPADLRTRHTQGRPVQAEALRAISRDYVKSFAA
jgi:hypothetical protein